MQVWRMAFRNGPGKENSLWGQCLKHALAVIAYPRMDFDLTRNRPEEVPRRWARLASVQKSSLKDFAYHVKKTDLIYVKEGREIVGCGVVQRAYRFHPKCPVKNGGRWPHVLDVNWQRNFPRVEVFVGDNQRYTVRPLKDVDLRKLKKARLLQERKETKQRQREYAIEGELEKRQRLFRKRNRTLIEVKKKASDYRCEICGLKYDGMYGTIGARCIVAHHIDLLAGRKEGSRTSLDDIALLCANCHAMIHQRNPPFRPSELRERLHWEWVPQMVAWRVISHKH